jgi:2-dehydro-3-deoxygluconokinase
MLGMNKLSQLDVVTLGETMVLFNPMQNLPLEYVHQFGKQIGGAESNVAIGLQRLGHRTGWISKLGDDAFGRYVHQFIRGEGIDTSHCLFTAEAPTGIFFKEKRSPTNMNVYYYRSRSAASLLQPEELDEDYIGSAKVLHLTGITPALSPSARDTVYKAIEVAKKHELKIVFDPNIRLKLWNREEAKRVLRDIAQHADVILPGLDEGQLITGKKTPETVVADLRTSEHQLFIVKLGAKGAYYDQNGQSGYVEGFPVKDIVDPVGAGDGFAAGIISGLLRHMPLYEVVRLGNAIGAIVVGVNGDVEGLPRWEEVQRMLDPDDEEGQDVKR